MGCSHSDIREHRPYSEFEFWNGILKVRAPRIAVIGTDCALGKRTTARWLTESCNENGIRAEMIFTGQTGWMQGHDYGFILDSTPNDFVPGELEASSAAIRKSNLMWFSRGQASLRHPAGPCGAVSLLGLARGVIAQHTSRWSFPQHGPPAFNLPLRRGIKLVTSTAAECWLCLSMEDLENLIYSVYVTAFFKFNLPVICPLEEGVKELLPVFQNFLKRRSLKIKSYNLGRKKELKEPFSVSFQLKMPSNFILSNWSLPADFKVLVRQSPLFM